MRSTSFSGRTSIIVGVSEGVEIVVGLGGSMSRRSSVVSSGMGVGLSFVFVVDQKQTLLWDLLAFRADLHSTQVEECWL